MKQFIKLVKRNVKLFFKDKGLFFTSLVTPLILLVLYSTFLGNVFQSSYTSVIPDGVEVSDKIINSIVSGQLFASIIAVSCVTVAFCSNMLMVQDKISGVRKDFLIAPIKQHKLALSYLVATFINTLIVCLFASLLCFGYMAVVGWYFSFGDVLLIILDVILLTLFGTLLASIINSFLTSQGQISAVGTIVSSVYGFICGAYMPIATFGKGLQNVLMFLPSTYSTALIKNHTMNAALDVLLAADMPKEMLNAIRQSNDLNLFFFGNQVSIGAIYVILLCTILALLSVYVLINFRCPKRTHKYIKVK